MRLKKRSLHREAMIINKMINNDIGLLKQGNTVEKYVQVRVKSSVENLWKNRFIHRLKRRYIGENAASFCELRKSLAVK